MARETKKSRSRRTRRPPLESRFTFLGDAVAGSDRKALRSAQFEVLDNLFGIERSLKLWRKTGAAVDAGLRQLWLHEMRQIQRVMSYSGAPDPDKRLIVVEGGGPSMSHEANLARLSEVAARGWDEQLAYIDGRTASLHQEFMLVRVVDGVPRNLPDSASATLRDIVSAAIALPLGTTRQDRLNEVRREKG